MAIPDYQTVMLPLLRFLKDGREHNIGQVVDALSDEFNLSPEERQQLLASGQQTVILNRAGWARTYLKKAGLIESVRRGYFRITERGKSVLASKPERIDVKYLERFPEFKAFRELRHDRPGDAPLPGTIGSDATPEEALDAAYGRLRLTLEADLLDQVKTASPTFFERLVVELLVRMGYGGTLRDAGQAVGKSGDGGIDGIIKEDRLGLDAIYIQAKRWDSTVGRPEIQKFAGALQGHRARKGVFITTSSFSADALDFASRIDSKIVLIDGAALAKHMIDHNVGVSVARSYEVKRIDSDYFSED
ncbi:MAG: restriction endonuclease [Acidobacteria bacterium]|jgi:restriction system protein|nr:restriction endonuclease [Acidobacteriota bacterium]